MLITENYRKLNAQLHAEMEGYGRGGGKVASTVVALAESLGTQDVLDYGCGKATLTSAMPFPIRSYDPAIPEYADTPEPADIVVCTDVLEHIEHECLADVLLDLKRVTRQLLFAIIATKAAHKTLPDGRNAHLIVMPAEWWINHLSMLFRFHRLDIQKPGFVALMEPRNA